MMDSNIIREKVREFYNKMDKRKHGRYRSWEHCKNFFLDNHDKTDNYTKDLMCLHLGFYLASWGMMRGSTFLLQHDYQVHMEAVNTLLKNKYKPLFNCTAENLKNIDIQKKIFECKNELINCYRGTEKDKTASDTLITKIMMGVYGCVPAYDSYFKLGMREFKISSTFGEKSINSLCDFYFENKDSFNSIKEEINQNGTIYTDMKLVDMFFWQIGLEIAEKQKNAKKQTNSQSSLMGTEIKF